MKILFLVHRIPYPPNKGDKLRAFNILTHLAQKHQIDLLSFLDSPAEGAYVNDLKGYCASIGTVCRCAWRSFLNAILFLPTRLPLTLGFFYSAEFKRMADEKLKQNKYDLIFVFSSSMAQYVEHYAKCPKILDLVDADSEKWLQYAQYAPWWKAVVYRLEGKRMRLYEQEIAQSFDVCTLVTEQEKQILKSIIPGDKLQVVKNGFNINNIKGLQSEKDTAPTLLFIGGMFYFAYIDGILHFYQNAFPLIREKFPQTKLYIVGADPAPSILRLKNDPQVEVTGHVPEVIPYLQKTWVYIVPLRVAPGIQNKILEAMAARLPIVATSAAISGIEAEHGKEVLIADKPEDFAAAVIKLLNDEQLRNEIGNNGHRFVEENYDWSKNLQQLDNIIGRL